ncbi:ribbon-helix-helix protein, CopG family [Aquibium microcysteis]|uniref:ribbon-helix-helix protein, CopG family n=1 Tax=Aquibium microcysteis TaxID=675281 RepID=UPI00165D1387|nr:ribbon-helix-helix protein, CopG family [Aquibium microcysteis]
MGSLVEIKEEQLQELDRIARETDRTRSALIEDALAEYLNRRKASHRDRAFGLWRERNIDGLAYQEEIRKEW